MKRSRRLLTFAALVLVACLPGLADSHFHVSPTVGGYTLVETKIVGAYKYRAPETVLSAGELFQQRGERLGRRDVRTVARLELQILPAVLPPRPLGERPEHIVPRDPRAVDVDTRNGTPAPRRTHCVLQRRQRGRYPPRDGPGQIRLP